MANLYGVANAPAAAGSIYCIGSADINCPAGTETNVFDGGLSVAPSQGWFYPLAWVTCVISLGATAPSALAFALRVNNGADQFTIGANAALLVANTTTDYTYGFAGQSAQIPWMGTGGHIQISVNPTGQPVTLRYAGSMMTAMLLRAPDQ